MTPIQAANESIRLSEIADASGDIADSRASMSFAMRYEDTASSADYDAYLAILDAPRP
jgi:hypothetical protein